jgi:hypothetical protein
MKPAIGKGLGYLQRMALQKKLQDAYPALTGMQAADAPNVGNLIKNLMLGGASGAVS